MSRDNIVNDLIRNRPQGPAGVDITYTVTNDYCYDAGRYKNFAEPSHSNYGYDDGALFDLGFKERSDVDLYLRKRDFENKSDWNLGRKKATLTRRVNRLWERISESVRRIQREGGRGIYKVKSNPYSGNVLGHLHAESMDEAKITAKIYFGYLADDVERMRVEFVRRGSVAEMTSLNQELVSDIDKQIERVKSEAANLVKRLENLNARKETLATVESQQAAVEMVNTLNALEG